MTRVEAAGLIRTLKRQLLAARLLRIGLFALLGTALLGALFAGDAAGKQEKLFAAAVMASAGWIALTVFSARQVRASQAATVHLSTGRLDLAEQQLKTALGLFSLYGGGKPLICHNLAVVAHGQRDYQAAAELCDGLISLGSRLSRGLGRACRILLADCRLVLGDTVAALRALDPISLFDPRLSLAERLLLLPIETRCHVARGDHQAAVEKLSARVHLAELLDAPRAALTHALLAQACRALGMVKEADFLARRAGLYHDLDELASEYPILKDSRPSPVAADNKEV